MDTLSYKTVSANKESANKKWFIVDADGQVLGRMASKIAKVLRGKYKTNYTPHADCGDYVVIINSSKIIMTGKKMEDRKLFSYTGYPGGQKKTSPAQILEKDPRLLIKHAIKGMLPKTKLGAAILKNCYIYSESEHKQSAQNPEPLDLNNLK